MAKRKIKRTESADCRVPKSAPQPLKFHCIMADPPWMPSLASGKDS